MGLAMNSALAGILLFAVYVYRLQAKRGAVAYQHGCGTLAKHWSKEPFSAFDFAMKMHVDIPSLYHYHQRYGPTFQAHALLSQPSIITIAPENIRAVNTGSEWGVEPMRLAGMEHFCGHGFLTTDGEIWSRSRKLLKPTFNKGNVADLSFLSVQVDSMLRQLGKEGTTVDLQPLFYTMFLNTSLNFLLGIDPTTDSIGAPHTSEQFIDAFHDALFLTMFKILLGKAWKLVPQTKYLNACKITHEYLDYYVDQALGEAGKPSDNVEKDLDNATKLTMLRALSIQTDEREYIRNQILQGMMASQETVSALLGNACFLLSRHPNYWQRLRNETKDKDMTSFTYDALMNFRLVQNICYEVLRLYPVFPLMARTALKDQKLPVGAGPNKDCPVFVPKDTMVVMSYYALHRDPAVFGQDVEDFRPERWDSIHPGQWTFMAFGGGNRACLGQKKVLLEAAYFLIRLAKAYSTLESRDSRDWKGELKLTCKSANGCKVALF